MNQAEGRQIFVGEEVPTLVEPLLDAMGGGAHDAREQDHAGATEVLAVFDADDARKAVVTVQRRAGDREGLGGGEDEQEKSGNNLNHTKFWLEWIGWQHRRSRQVRSTKLSTTFLRPALSNSTVSLLPST
jgi:hypothetical protein